MRLRQHDKGFDFPADREAADAAQAGLEDERLRMESILLTLEDCMNIRRGLSNFPEVLRLVSSHDLIEPEMIAQLVEALKVARKDALNESARRRIDRLVTKCLQWQGDGLPVFADV